MKDFFQKSGGLLLTIAFLLSVLVGGGAILMEGSTMPITNAMGVITTPFRNMSSAVVVFGENVHTFFDTYKELDAKVEELELEVARLEQVGREGVEALEENVRLRELLGLQAKHRNFEFESARVTARSFTGWESVITLDKGTNQGIAEKDCVVTEAGHIVGVVSSVGENWCTVATIVSISTSMGGTVSRTNSTGLLEGDFSLMAEGKLRLNYLPDDAQLIAGDQVLTSGLGQLYPEGLTVGKIQGVFSDSAGLGRYAVIEPDVSLPDVVQVFVIKDFDIVK